MSSAKGGGTLFEIVPALGKITSHGAGTARLMATDSSHRGITLRKGLNRLGRDPAQNDHVISSSHVSRAHCTVLMHEEAFQVSDLQSHNGTFINGVRVMTGALKPGDTLGLSRRVNLVLVMDSAMDRPVQKVIDLGGEAPAPAPLPGPLIPVASIEVEPLGSPADVVSGPAEPAPPAGKPDHAAQLRQLEIQYDELNIIYQVALHCLRSKSAEEAEELLSNVIQRMLPLDGGFVLYQHGELWRAAICPASRTQPSNALIKAFFKRAQQGRGAEVISADQELGTLGLGSGSALVVPLTAEERLRGVIGAFTSQAAAYSPQRLSTMIQLGEVATAALRAR